MDSETTKMSEEDIDKIVEKAVDKAIEKLYTEIGKSVIKKGLWLIGFIMVSAALWLSNGHVPK